MSQVFLGLVVDFQACMRRHNLALEPIAEVVDPGEAVVGDPIPVETELGPGSVRVDHAHYT